MWETLVHPGVYRGYILLNRGKLYQLLLLLLLKTESASFIMFEGRRPIIYPVYSTNNTLIIVRCYKQMCPLFYCSLGSEEITVGFV